MRFACFSCMSKPAVIEEDVCPAFITARHFEPSIPTSEPPLPLALDVPAAAAKCGPLQESAPALAVEKSTESEKKIEPEKVVKRKQLGPQTSDLVTRYESYSKEREARVFKEGVQISAIRSASSASLKRTPSMQQPSELDACSRTASQTESPAAMLVAPLAME